jgi:hypothetical protein
LRSCSSRLERTKLYYRSYETSGRLGEVSNEYVEIECKGLRETTAAIKIYTGRGTCWIPKSQLREQVTALLPADITIEVPEWLAVEKGLV